MEIADILPLIGYNFWADDRILQACARLSTEEFTRPITPDPGWGSLRGILIHTLDTECGWRCVLQGQDASEILEPDDFPVLETLEARWGVEREAWLAYARELSTETLNASYKTSPGSGLKAWHVIVHVMNHGTQHRSEAAAILTGYGQSPGDIDFDQFLREHWLVI